MDGGVGNFWVVGEMGVVCGLGDVGMVEVWGSWVLGFGSISISVCSSDS